LSPHKNGGRSSLLIVLTIALFAFGCSKAREARELKKQRKAEAVPMSGMLSFMADAATLKRCDRGENFPVLFKGDWLAVERAYVNTRKVPGEPILIAFRGRMENDSTDGRVRDAVVIEEITEMWPDSTCSGVN
jgi:uncharacterized lipoprotein NlpE involved in copper resistance